MHSRDYAAIQLAANFAAMADHFAADAAIVLCKRPSHLCWGSHRTLLGLCWTTEPITLSKELPETPWSTQVSTKAPRAESACLQRD